MAFVNYNGTLVIRKSATVDVLVINNSSDFTAGGDYQGPTAFLGIVTSPHHQLITTVSTGIEFTQQQNDLQTLCIYHVALRNDGTRSNTIRLDGFYDG